MSDPGCPERQRLSAFVAGELPQETAEKVRAHVDTCPTCQATVRTISDCEEKGTGTSRDADLADSAPRGSEPVPFSSQPPRPMPDMSAADVPVGRLGEYEVLEKLGEGGMGAVYKARHTELDRVVALKVLPKHMTADDRAVARFKREMKAVARLDHPNIVRAHDAREIDGVHFLVIEHVDGMDLAELVGRYGPVPIADACELVRQAALGLECAHGQGLVHRDVKPSNLMLGADGRVKVLDLGLARFRGRAQGEEMTATGQVVGTPDYMAPEQASDSRLVDARTDLYSLGCTLYKLLVGQAPFSGPAYQTAFNKMAAHVGEAVPPVRQSRPDVPKQLAAVLDRMMAKEPDRRPATAAQVAESLGQFAPGSDLPGLLAAARGTPGPDVTTSGAEGLSATPSIGESTRRAAMRRTQPARRKLWAALAAVALLMLLIPMGAALVDRFFQGGGQTAVPAKEKPDGGAGTGIKETEESKSKKTPAVAPRGAGPPGWIVMSWARPRIVLRPKPDLWLLSADGRSKVRITRDPTHFDVQPSFSPDGRRIAFIRGESTTGPNGVWVCSTDGSGARQVVAATGASERFVSPVWLSTTRICYARDPVMDQQPDMEAWQVDLDGAGPQRMFRFQDALGQGAGVVTGVSPDGRQLAVVAQSEGLWPTADVYVTDLEGKLVQTIWEDDPDDRKDGRALWSPDGRRIAWHHSFTRGAFEKTVCFGVGLARLDDQGRWIAQLQPGRETFITPLAFSPDGRYLLCARLKQTRRRVSGATLLLMDDQFHGTRELFEMEAFPWQPGQRDLGRLADWAEVPEDVKLPAEE